MSIIISPNELPEVSFIGDITLEGVRAQMVEDYRAKFEELTGRATELPADDKNRLLLSVCALQIYQGFQFIENAGRMNLLKYARGEFLDNLAALKNVKRNESAKSTVVVQFTKASEAVNDDITIPRLTRVAAEDYNIYWMTPDVDITIPAGRSSYFIECECTEEGSFSNGFESGEINRLIDAAPFIESVTNTTASSGGSDHESDDSLRLRALNAPSGWSSAGSADSYRYCIMQLSSQIADVSVQNGENDGEISVYVLMKSGIPTDDQIAQLQALVDAADFRPLTDSVTLEKAIASEYALETKYYIANRDANKVATICEAVEAAVDEYIAEQSSTLGKNINPSALIQKMMNAGAADVSVRSPAWRSVPDTNCAVLTGRSVQYMGLE